MGYELMGYENDTREGFVYLTVKADRSSYGLQVVKATANKPRSTPEGSIVIRLEVEVPRKAFQPLRPEAKVVIPKSVIEEARASVETSMAEYTFSGDEIHDAVGSADDDDLLEIQRNRG